MISTISQSSPKFNNLLNNSLLSIKYNFWLNYIIIHHSTLNPVVPLFIINPYSDHT